MPESPGVALLWLNPTAKPVEVTAIADALVRPDFADRGFHDTAVVTIRFDNGSIAVAEATGVDARNALAIALGRLKT